jgi:hypothetical protein
MNLKIAQFFLDSWVFSSFDFRQASHPKCYLDTVLSENAMCSRFEGGARRYYYSFRIVDAVRAIQVGLKYSEKFMNDKPPRN